MDDELETSSDESEDDQDEQQEEEGEEETARRAEDASGGDNVQRQTDSRKRKRISRPQPKWSQEVTGKKTIKNGWTDEAMEVYDLLQLGIVLNREEDLKKRDQSVEVQLRQEWVEWDRKKKKGNKGKDYSRAEKEKKRYRQKFARGIGTNQQENFHIVQQCINEGPRSEKVKAMLAERGFIAEV